MKYNYTTKRLIVKEWHSFEDEEFKQADLESVVQDILVPDTTKYFPIMWRGDYDKRRAKFWIQERDSEAKTLLAVDKETKNAIGYVTFFRVGELSQGLKIRLGYLFSHSMWNKGFATEVVGGFMNLCKENNISTVLAGVDPSNTASIRVLEKNNFLIQKKDTNGIHHLFEYKLF